MSRRSTRDLRGPMRHEPPIGDRWWWSLRLEYLGRNLAVGGALEFSYRLGRAHRDFEEACAPRTHPPRPPPKKRSVTSG